MLACPTPETAMNITSEGPGLTVRTPAKLNLFLEVLGKRDDGFHELESVFQTVSLYDELTLERAEKDITIMTDTFEVPDDDTNLAVRAALAMREHTGCGLGAAMTLAKKIPVAAGMGGGSSDAAAALVGLNQLWELDLPRETLHAIAAEIGSDVPFFLYGGTAVCRGRGEKIEPIDDVPPRTYVVVYPGIHVSTREVYENLPANLTKVSADIRLFLSLLLNKPAGDDALPLFNRLESVTIDRYEPLAGLRQRMKESGLTNVIMTGSGSAFFGTVSDDKEARSIAEELTEGDVGQVFIVESTH